MGRHCSLRNSRSGSRLPPESSWKTQQPLTDALSNAAQAYLKKGSVPHRMVRHSEHHTELRELYSCPDKLEVTVSAPARYDASLDCQAKRHHPTEPSHILVRLAQASVQKGILLHIALTRLCPNSESLIIPCPCIVVRPPPQHDKQQQSPQ